MISRSWLLLCYLSLLVAEALVGPLPRVSHNSPVVLTFVDVGGADLSARLAPPASAQVKQYEVVALDKRSAATTWNDAVRQLLPDCIVVGRDSALELHAASSDVVRRVVRVDERDIDWRELNDRVFATIVDYAFASSPSARLLNASAPAVLRAPTTTTTLLTAPSSLRPLAARDCLVSVFTPVGRTSAKEPKDHYLHRPFDSLQRQVCTFGCVSNY